MADWHTLSLGEIAEVFDGPHATPKTVDFGPIFLGIGALDNGRINLGETRHVTAEDFAIWTRRVKPRAGDVVFSYETRLGQAAIIPSNFECCLGRRMGLLRVKPDKADPHFLLYSYISPQFQELLRSRTIPGATVDRLPLKDFSGFPIVVPPMEVQRSISSLLGALDDKIEVNRRMNETLEAMAQAIFRDWFVDFGPVRRKLAGATDPVEIMGGLVQYGRKAAELAELFPHSLGSDELPVGWGEVAIGDLIDIAGGSTPSTADPSLWEPAEHRWATPKDLSNMSDLTLFDTGRRISSAGLAKITSGLLPSGTVLLSSRAPIGYLAIAQAPVAINQGFIALKPTADFGSAYLYLWCKANMEAILANANGSTFQEISKKNFRPITSAVPDDHAVCRAFGEIAEPMIARIVAAAAENKTLAETRDYLLPRLMSGKISVAPAEAEG